MNKSAILLIFLLIPLSLSAFDLQYPEYGEILSEYTNEGLVCYRELKCDLCPLRSFLCEAAAVTREQYCSWSGEDRAAFLINLYNAQALYMVACNYPIWGICRLGTMMQSIFEMPTICLFGRRISMFQLECKLFDEYGDPRVFFALSPATLGGGPLRSEPYIGSELDDQLEDQAATFMRNRAKQYLEPCVCAVYISPIFYWQKSRFDCSYGSVWAFIRPYFREEWCTEVYPPCWRIRSSRYDWMLNDWCRCLGHAYAAEGEPDPNCKEAY